MLFSSGTVKPCFPSSCLSKQPKNTEKPVLWNSSLNCTEYSYTLDALPEKRSIHDLVKTQAEAQGGTDP